MHLINIFFFGPFFPKSKKFGCKKFIVPKYYCKKLLVPMVNAVVYVQVRTTNAIEYPCVLFDARNWHRFSPLGGLYSHFMIT